MEKWISETLDGGIHAFTGGAGSTVVMVPGWPETAEAYSEVFPYLAPGHSIICVDPPGLGDSVPSPGGYDTAAVSRQLNEALRPRTESGFHLVGHDVGAWIAYAWAAQFPDRIKSLTVLDGAIPGFAPKVTFPLPYEANMKLWHFSFNILPELPEMLTAGREREYFDWLFRYKAKYPERISPVHRDRYVQAYAKPGALTRAFTYYRAMAHSASQNVEFSARKLPMPVLALAGDSSMGDNLRSLMEPLAEHVEGGAIDDCGHYVMEEQPEIVATRLLKFLGQVEGNPA